MPSSSAVHQELTKILPSLTNIPPRLTSFAESLLARSRQRAGHLKGQEETARAYICAHIACERLRATLRLPPIKQNQAPLPPRDYKKLYAFLDRVLDNEIGTPKKRKAEDIVPASRNADHQTPSKKQKTSTPVSKKGSDFVGRVEESASKTQKNEGEAPAFVLPTVRKLCKTHKTPEMIPHVYTGVCVVLKLAQMWPRSAKHPGGQGKGFEADITYLVVALYLMTLTRMQRGKMFETLDETEKIESWIKKINKQGYCKGQGWFDSVPEGVLDFSLDAVNDDAADAEEQELMDASDEEPSTRSARKGLHLDEDDPEDVLLPGLGTMMQESIDWLNRDKKVAFESWMKDMIRKIDRIDKPTKAGRAVPVK